MLTPTSWIYFIEVEPSAENQIFFYFHRDDHQVFSNWHFTEVPAFATSSGAELGKTQLFIDHNLVFSVDEKKPGLSTHKTTSIFVSDFRL